MDSAISTEAAKELFLACGFDNRRTEETLKNAVLTKALFAVLTEAKAMPECNMKSIFNFLYTVATSLDEKSKIPASNRSTLVKYIVSGKVGKVNLPLAIAHLKKLGPEELGNNNAYEKEWGVGVVVTREDVKKAASEHINSKKTELLAQRYRYPIAGILGIIRDQLKFANPKDIKDEVDAQILSLLGEKTKEDTQPKEEKSKLKKVEELTPQERVHVRFPDPAENKQNAPVLLAKHLKETGGQVRCRFPPEPNGYLHVGHAKSMNLNFNYPKNSPKGGITILRFDDTNPDAEKKEFFEGIIKDVGKMGYTPDMTTWSSDYFPKLYEFAIQLIKSGKAYVDHQTPDQIAEYREKCMDSPWRDRPIEESLKLFEDMRVGKFEEGAATLRMKMDMKSDNPCMRDLIAYRIKYTPHPHAGDKWCIYPSYDYTHCIIDSLENITHSLCTLEFLPRRESYYWLLDALGLYKPLVWEFSRLSFSHTILSKRKLLILVNNGYVKGWDDPRLPTIRGLLRRGFTPTSMNDICTRVGVTTVDNTTHINLLEQCCREDLDKAPRVMTILDPLKVTIKNAIPEEKKTVTVPNHPKNTALGTHTLPFSNVIYIERSDFRLQDAPGYKRLAPNKNVGLVHANCILTCTDVINNETGDVKEIVATVNWDISKKPQGFIHWVASPDDKTEPTVVEVRLYDRLFKSYDAASLGDNWLSDLNPDSLKVLSHCYIDSSAKGLPAGTHRQFERTGYFVVDPDSTPEKQVWNRVVSLKEAKDKEEVTTTSANADSGK